MAWGLWIGSSIEQRTESVVSGSLDYGCTYVRSSVEVATTSVRRFYMQIKVEMEEQGQPC